MAGYRTERGIYANGTPLGVRVIDQAGNPFPGITQMQADDGTYYTPPVQRSVTFTNLQPDSEVRVYLQADRTELTGVENSGTSFTYNYVYSEDQVVYYVVFHLSYLPIKVTDVVLGNNDLSFRIAQVFDRVSNLG